MSTHKLNIRFTDKQGNRGKIRMYFPEIDMDEYGWFALGDEGSEHIVVAFDEKPDLDEIFSEDEEPELIKGTDEDGNKVYIAYAGIDDLSDIEIEGEDGEIIGVQYSSGSSKSRSGGGSKNKAGSLADKLRRNLGKGGKSTGKSSGGRCGKGGGQKCTKSMINKAARAAGVSPATYASVMGGSVK